MSSAVLGSYALAMPIASAAHALDAVSPRTPRLLIRVPFRIWSVYVPIRYTSNVWPARLAPSAPCSVMVAPAAIADGASARPASMLAVAQAIAVTIIGMRRVVPCLHGLSRTGNDPTPVDAAWLASNGSNPATFTADGLYLPGFRPNPLIGFGVRLMGMVVFVSFNVHAKSVDSNIFSVFTKVFE